MKIVLVIATLFTVFLMSPQAVAKNRAVIVGISVYQNPANNVRGPDGDIPIARSIAQRLKFTNEEIVVLKDKQATRDNILDALRAVAKDTGTNDRAFIYYSGHGTRVADKNGDEADGCDEAIFPYDEKTIIDDELGAELDRIQAREVMVMFDSCFSGTATKSVLFGNLGQGKGGSSLRNPKVYKLTKTDCTNNVNKGTRDLVAVGSDTQRISVTPSAQQPTSKKSLLEIDAAASNEVAFGQISEDRPGSLFTAAFNEILKQYPSNVSFKDLHVRTTQFIAKLKDLAGIPGQTPQLAGPQDWLAKNFYDFGRLSSPNTPGIDNSNFGNAASNQTLFDRVVAGGNFRVEMSSPQLEYNLGDQVEFTVASSQSGYLTILQLGASGNVTVLFPNQFNSSNYIKAGIPVQIPMDIGGFVLQVDAPAGENRIVAVVTAEPIPLDQFDSTGQFITIDKLLSKALGKAFVSATKDVNVYSTQSAAYGATEVRIIAK